MAHPGTWLATQDRFALQTRFRGQVPNTLPLDWLCGDCDGDGPNPRTVLDITLDTGVLYYLRQGAYPHGKTEKEKTRIRNRARRFEFQDTQLCRKADATHSIRIEDRAPLTKQAHEATGHFGLKRVMHFLQRTYYWNKHDTHDHDRVGGM